MRLWAWGGSGIAPEGADCIETFVVAEKRPTCIHFCDSAWLIIREVMSTI
jgi:hypothetical protein